VKISPNIAYQLFLGCEFRETSCLNSEGFWGKSHSGLMLDVQGTSGSEIADRARFLLGTWGFHRWVSQGCIRQPRCQSISSNLILQAARAACTTVLPHSQSVVLRFHCAWCVWQSQSRIFSVIFYRWLTGSPAWYPCAWYSASAGRPVPSAVGTSRTGLILGLIHRETSPALPAGCFEHIKTPDRRFPSCGRLPWARPGCRASPFSEFWPIS
jgi:hypothetical protein